MNAIRFENVSYEYKRLNDDPIKAIKNLSLDIPQGQFVVICGSNGSGKSTLAKHINGLLLPNEGNVNVYDMNTLDKDRIYEIRSKIGMVFQNPDNQMIASIVEDDIAFGPENLGVPRDEIIERVDWALKAVGMEEYRHATPFKMSGGQKQRIAIAAVLAMLPKVLVLDESTAMLDPKGRREIIDTVTRLNKEEGITIVHITHHMEEAINADRLIVMNDGKIVLDDKPENIFCQIDKIKKYAMDLPYVMGVQQDLLNNEIDVDGYIKNEEELGEKLCQLL